MINFNNFSFLLNFIPTIVIHI